jgi:hypothetical protein
VLRRDALAALVARARRRPADERDHEQLQRLVDRHRRHLRHLADLLVRLHDALDARHRELGADLDVGGVRVPVGRRGAGGGGGEGVLALDARGRARAHGGGGVPVREEGMRGGQGGDGRRVLVGRVRVERGIVGVGELLVGGRGCVGQRLDEGGDDGRSWSVGGGLCGRRRRVEVWLVRLVWLVWLVLLMLLMLLLLLARGRGLEAREVGGLRGICTIHLFLLSRDFWGLKAVGGGRYARLMQP